MSTLRALALWDLRQLEYQGIDEMAQEINKQKLQRTLRKVISLLVAKDYSAIEQISGGKRLGSVEMADAVRQYGRTLSMPKDDIEADIVGVEGSSPARWSVVVTLETV